MRIFACILFVSLTTSGLLGAEVEAEGKAAGDLPHAREEALADALREAVRIGAGVDVLSCTAVKDFTLEFDRVISASFGHVKNYKILSSSLGQDGIYRIRVKANVGEGAPNMSEVLALKQIVQLKQSPRVAIKIEEVIDGVPTPKAHAAGWFQQTAQKLQLSLLDLATVDAADARRAVRDDLLNNGSIASMRRAGAAQKVDFLIEGKIDARHAGKESLFGSLPVHAFELGGEIRVIRPDTGEIVASLILPSANKLKSGLQDREMAFREALYKFLDNEKGAQSGMTLFSKLFAQWIVEVDCGAIKRVEFSKISSSDFQKVKTSLKAVDKVSSVWEREFDSKGTSLIDVETRLASSDLGVEIQKIAGSTFELDRTTESYLQFTRKTDIPAETSSAPSKLKGLLNRLLN